MCQRQLQQILIPERYGRAPVRDGKRSLRRSRAPTRSREVDQQTDIASQRNPLLVGKGNDHLVVFLEYVEIRRGEGLDMLDFCILAESLPQFGHRLAIGTLQPPP
jgi:diaminopimelate epimerase